MKNRVMIFLVALLISAAATVSAEMRTHDFTWSATHEPADNWFDETDWSWEPGWSYGQEIKRRQAIFFFLDGQEICRTWDNPQYRHLSCTFDMPERAEVLCFNRSYPGGKWEAGQAVNPGDRIAPSLDDWHVSFRCIQAGITGTQEPDWFSTGVNGTLDDGSAVWQRLNDGDIVSSEPAHIYFRRTASGVETYSPNLRHMHNAD